MDNSRYVYCSADSHFPMGLSHKLYWGHEKYLQTYMFLIPKKSSQSTLLEIKWYTNLYLLEPSILYCFQNCY